MTTDTALITSHLILHHQIPFSKIKFCDKPEFELSKHERLEIPFRYLAQGGEEYYQDYLPVVGGRIRMGEDGDEQGEKGEKQGDNDGKKDGEGVIVKPRMARGMFELLKKQHLEMDFFEFAEE